MTSTTGGGDYVLGTGDVELQRLGLQHRVWRPRALDAWRRAGFTVGQRLLDVGCGPGYATLDLAGIVGPSGEVVAIDRSRRFLDALDAECRRQDVGNVRVLELDLADGELPELVADGAWCRWLLCFLPRPRDVVLRVARALRPGGTFVLHEYIHYETWRFAPPCREHDQFVAEVVASWRATGGEPDVGLTLPRWLEDAGLVVESLRVIVDVVSPDDFAWHWPRSFIESGLARLVELGRLSTARAREVATGIAAAEREPGIRMVTPAVLEVIARRPRARSS